jgi:hypothetical protein
MRCCSFLRACVLLIATHGVAATLLDAHRVLKAATKRADLLKRGLRIAKRFDAVVDYVEGMFACNAVWKEANME